MVTTFPESVHEFMALDWPAIEPYYQELLDRRLDPANLEQWLADWTHLANYLHETHTRLRLAVRLDTTDQEAYGAYKRFLDEIYPPSQQADQTLKEKLLGSGLEPEGFAIPLRNMRAEAELFREANLPLLTKEQELSREYDQIVGAQTVVWEGEEVTLVRMSPHYQSPDRSVRARAWRLVMDRWLGDREAINALWPKFLTLRGQLAANAGYTDYRAYRWLQMKRFDYTLSDSLQFHNAIEAVVVPAAKRIYERRRRQLGVERLRPWDLEVDPHGRPPLAPFTNVETLQANGERIFQQLDPQLGDYFGTMRRENLLDLENRKGKAPGGFCTSLAVAKRPFIFMNAVGIHDNVMTLLHEAGHAFHVFERTTLPFHHQRQVGMEFAEVASMAMELLAAPYLEIGRGGFYSPEEASRAAVALMEEIILFWPYMAVVDAFQHWVYEHPTAAMDPANCDAQWALLWDRFMVGVDWSDLADEKMTGWHRKLHIHRYPFYYIEYGLARLGGVQVWRNAQRDPQAALVKYREALALGGTVTLPELYHAAGAELAFDQETLGEAVELVEGAIAELEGG